jgi:hypothetical protein
MERGPIAYEPRGWVSEFVEKKWPLRDLKFALRVTALFSGKSGNLRTILSFGRRWSAF